MKPITVLSLFDGMSCGQIALERAGIKVKKYYASEIDRWTIQVTQKNYPNTIQLGDIQNWQEWDIDTPDLIIAGSPCQGFSNSGKGMNFDDPRSKLFFTFKDILFYWIDRNPKLKFLLENVKMKKEWRDVITDYMGLDPILINSALVSAQNRERLYWANWNFPQPEDRGIYLKDIVEHGDVDRAKDFALDANYFKGGNPKQYFEKGRRQLVFTRPHGYMKESHKEMGKYPSLCAQNPNTKHLLVTGAAIRNQVTSRGVENKSNCVVSSYPGKLNGVVIKDKSNSVRVGGRKSPPGSKQVWDNILLSKDDYRGLTVLECERLQTVPEGYTEGVSNTQRYKMLGNGWTIDVLAHIFSHM